MLTGRMGRAFRALAWLVIALAVALGAAGIVAGASLPPGDATRPELTARADARMALDLAPLESGLGQLAGQLQRLVDAGKGILFDLHDQPAGAITPGQVAAQLDQGDALLLAIEAQAQQLQAAYVGLPYDASSERIGGHMKARLLALRAAFGALGPVTADWQLVSSKATVATKLLAALREHDLLAAAAVLQASNKDAAGKAKAPDLAGATTTLKAAMASLAQATAIRDQLRQTIDTSTLDAWLERNQTWDRALQTYFRLAQTSRDPRVLQRAYLVEEAARKLLPKTTDALIVIVGEIEAGGLMAALGDLQQIQSRLTLVAQVE